MLSAKNESGCAVDWWFMYKLPSGVGDGDNRHKTQGNEYLYYDPARQQPLQLSPHRLGTEPQGAFYHSLMQLFGSPGAETGWILYNDEYPQDMSPYRDKGKPWWQRHIAEMKVEGMTIDGEAERQKLIGLMRKEGLVDKDSQPDNAQLLAFKQVRELLIGEIDEIQQGLTTSWQQGDSDWPAGVAPKINSGKARRSDRGKPVDHGSNGHCKGVLAFDLASDSAFWLSHSTPRTPSLHQPDANRFFYPDSASQYAQTFICISLGSVADACKIAEVLAQQHQPQVFGCRLPEAITRQSDCKALWQLAQGSVPPGYGDDYVKTHGRKPPADLSFQSRGIDGDPKVFRLIAKSAAWDDDFWVDLVGPKLQCDLRIETWRRLTATAILPRNDQHSAAGSEDPAYFGTEDFSTSYKGRQYHHEFIDSDGHDLIDEVTNIDLAALTDPSGLLTGEPGAALSGYRWPYTHDHAKWAISESVDERGVKTAERHNGERLIDKAGTAKDWVCVADLNRMTSQEKRGGGAICFHEPLLWHGLNQIERISGKIT